MIIVNNVRSIGWQGLSGKVYEYAIFPITETNFPNQPGNFIFASEVEKGLYIPFYINHTFHLKHTIANLKANRVIERYGLYTIHTHVNWSDSDRLMEIKDLINEWSPACNNILNF